VATEYRSRLVVVPHSLPAAERAEQLFATREDTRIFAPVESAPALMHALARVRPQGIYLIDVGRKTTLLAFMARLLGISVILDTGDLVYELERSRGARSRVGLAAVWLGEQLSLRLANAVVVRGRLHEALLSGRRVTFAPDLAPRGARPISGVEMRARLGLDGEFVVGLVGSLQTAPRLGISYGWDLVEALFSAPSEVHALVVGDGPARPALETRAAELGVTPRCHFVGSVPPDEVAPWVGAMDAAVSTQTNDRVGAVRTTGKLPLYLACGCPVLASDVGEARRLLGPLGWTIPYEGIVDRTYPARLAAALAGWARDRAGAPIRREQALRLHREAFDEGAVRDNVWHAVDAVLGRKR
jgi:glycosyltransferase involved in cell wall biosynthesis